MHKDKKYSLVSNLLRAGLLFLFVFFCLVSNAQSVIKNIIVNAFKAEIYLPAGHHKSFTYKAIYFNDGQSLFGNDDNSFGLQKILDSMISEKRIEPVIVVAVHSQADRMNNYIPYKDESIPPDFGSYTPAANEYTKRLVNEFIPAVERQVGKASKKAIMGYSFGGLHAAWACLNYPSEFFMSAAFSPSFWVAGYQIFSEAEKANPEQQYYFDLGTDEWNNYVPFITKSKLTLEKNIYYYEVPGGRHEMQDWKKRLPNALLLFAGKTDTIKYTWDVFLEVIPSYSNPGKYYLRLNPVKIYNSGLNYSLSFAANYKLENKQDGIVNADGSFSFNGTNDLRVTIIYKNELKRITVSYADVELRKQKKNN